MFTTAHKSAERINQLELESFINHCLDSFPKRDIIRFFSQNPNDSITAHDLARKIERRATEIWGELIELSKTELIEYDFEEHHRRVWRLTPDMWVRERVKAIEDYWIRHPQERYVIVHR
jgi:hypothetical protein